MNTQSYLANHLAATVLSDYVIIIQTLQLSYGFAGCHGLLLGWLSYSCQYSCLFQAPLSFFAQNALKNIVYSSLVDLIHFVLTRCCAMTTISTHKRRWECC